MPEPAFYLIVRGGSWGGGDPFRTYETGVHEVDVQVAQAVLAWKDKHPSPGLILSDVRPELEGGSPIALLADDLQPGVLPEGVCLLPGEDKPADGVNTVNWEARAQSLRPVYACKFCRSARFPSAAAAKRHFRHNHVLQPDKAEARVRAQLETTHD